MRFMLKNKYKNHFLKFKVIKVYKTRKKRSSYSTPCLLDRCCLNTSCYIHGWSATEDGCTTLFHVSATWAPARRRRLPAPCSGSKTELCPRTFLSAGKVCSRRVARSLSLHCAKWFLTLTCPVAESHPHHLTLQVILLCESSVFPRRSTGNS